MAELKPCPFCGSDAELKYHYFPALKAGRDRSFGVVCTHCKVETWQFYDSIRDAVEAWNRRAE